MTGPFQSIKDMMQNPHITSKPANDEQPQPSIDDVIAGLFGRRPASSSNSSADLDASFPGSEDCSPHGQTTGPSSQRPPLRGGEYSEADALALLNSHFMVGKSKHETAIFRINDDGTISFVPTEEFKLAVQNIFVKVGSKLVPAEKYWRESPDRHERVLVFKPGGTAQRHEYNLWRGFGVEPRKGWRKQRRFLRHLFKVICRRDKQKFRYLMSLLAWFVQNPDKHAEVVLVFKSREQGTGKSTVGKVMLDIFGQHGFLVDDKDRLLGRFNDWLETACFVLAEEILFAGDHKSDDKMKSIVTGDVLQVEGKYRSCRQVQNRTKFIATTNHDHAVAAGVRERRKVVFDVSNEHVGDRAWFDALYRDLADGGTSEFLWLLQNLRLGTWHPRLIIKTEETAEQQRMSGDSASQWSQACIIAEAIVGFDHGLERDLGTLVSSADLQNAYTGFCRRTGLRAVGPETFGVACTKMFGPKARLPAPPGSSKRPWGYHVPTASNWQQEVNKRLGL
jgi:hypothetical protein